ncbi:MAG: ParB/RepB/Spo0J family partition protein [Candidatus Aenigmatarchaeota archaeon]
MMDKINKRQFGNIKLEDIELDPLNVRKEGVRIGLEGLKTSIEKIGLIHPIIVTRKKGTKKFKVLVGQRRFTAFKELDYDTIPAIIINDIDNTSKRLISFTENISRSRLPYNDTIKVCDELFRNYRGPRSTRLKRISEDVGLPLQTVVNYLSYRIVPEEVRDLVDGGKIDRSQAYKLTSVFWPNSKKIVRIAKHMVGMTKPEWENILDIGLEDKNAPFEEIMEESKKPSRKITVKIKIERIDFDKLKQITRGSKNKIGVSDFISDILKDYLKGR